MQAVKFRHNPFTPGTGTSQSQTNALAANEKRVFLFVQYNGTTGGNARFEQPTAGTGGDINLGPGEYVKFDGQVVPTGTLYLTTTNGSFSVLEGSR